MVGITTNTQGQKVTDLKHTPDTITKTQGTRHLAQVCYEARHAVRKRLSSILSLRHGEFWFSDSGDVITFVCDEFDGLGVLSSEAATRHITGVVVSLLNSPTPALDLRIRRVGIDMTVLCRYRAHQANIHLMRLDRSDPQREQIAQQLRGFILRDSQVLLYLLRWLFPGSGVYTVWDDNDVAEFHTNAEARKEVIRHQRDSNGMVAQIISFIPHKRQWFGFSQIPGFSERFSKVSATLSNLKLGHVVYSSGGNGANGGSVTRITEMSVPEAIVP
jgi:hypothetical protein